MSNCGRCGHAGRNHTYGGACKIWGCCCSGYKFADYQDKPRYQTERGENPVITESAICLELKERIGDSRHDHGLVCRPEETLRCGLCGETYLICKVCHGDVYGHHATCAGRDQ